MEKAGGKQYSKLSIYGSMVWGLGGLGDTECSWEAWRERNIRDRSIEEKSMR